MVSLQKAIFGILLFILITPIFIVCSFIREDNGVLVLNDNNFQLAIKKHPFLLVDFYAPWCGYCKGLEPEYMQAAQNMKRLGLKMRLGKVDTTTEIKLSKRFNISYLPTLKFFRNSTPIDYTGSRKSSGIMKWVVRKSGIPAVVITNTTEMIAFLHSNPVSVIGFFARPNNEKSKIFLDLAETMDAHAFAICTHGRTLENQNAEDGTIMIFKSFDEKMRFFKGDFTLDNIRKFVEIYTLPLIAEFNKERASALFNGFIHTNLIFFISKRANHYNKYLKPLRPLARLYRGTIIFMYVPIDDEKNARMVDHFKIHHLDIPCMRLVDYSNGLSTYKPPTSNLTLEEVQSFLRSFTANLLQPMVQSQSLPKDWNARPVKVLVAENFNEIVYDKEKDVLVEFYSSGCMDCDRALTLFNQLTKIFPNTSNIIFTKIDVFLNDLENINIDYYPTIKLFRRGDNMELTFNKECTLKNLIGFIEKNRFPLTTNFTNYKKDQKKTSIEKKNEL